VYKQELRPLIREANLYHVSPRPDGVHWDGVEYFDANRHSGVLFAFRGSIISEGQHVFPMQGVQAGRNYRLHFVDSSTPDQTISGSKLMANGLTVVLPLPQSSELIFLEETR
jgi:Glycosyl hydrolase family 36 C-terminal domain